MIYLFLGKDDYSKKQYLKELQTKEQAGSVDYFYEWQQGEILQAVKNSGLFEKKKIVAVYDSIGKFEFEEFLTAVQGAQNILVFVEASLDRRKTETKKILANKNLNVVDFEIPAGADLRNVVAGDPSPSGNGQLTPTLKVRRHAVRAVYGPALDALYGDRSGAA